MLHVIVGLGANVADPQRQTRLRALQCLALRFLVAAQHQRLVRRVEIQPDDVPELLFKARVVRQFEGARRCGSMSLAAHRRCTLAGEIPRRGPRAAAPSPQVGRRRHRLLHDLLHRLPRQPRLAPAPGAIGQPVQPVQRKAPDPAVHGDA